MRYQRTPFCELKVLVEGDQHSESQLRELLVLDSKGQTYMKDYNKFLAECSASPAGGQRASNPGVPQGYY